MEKLRYRYRSFKSFPKTESSSNGNFFLLGLLLLPQKNCLKEPLYPNFISACLDYFHLTYRCQIVDTDSDDRVYPLSQTKTLQRLGKKREGLLVGNMVF